MKQQKNNKGISLIQLIVAIIIMMIITSFALWYASNTSTEAKLARIYAEIKTVKEAYENAIILNEVSEGTYDLESLSTTEESIISQFGADETADLLSEITDKSKLYLVTPENAKELEIEKLTMEYVIDGKTGEVYIIGGFARANENPKYSASQITKLYESTFK